MIAVALSLVVSTALAEGPGTRIRTTPEIAPAMELSHPPTPAERRSCEGLRSEARERCLRQARERDADQKPTGPEATGMGSAAGTTSGTAGAASGATTPR